MPEKKTKHILFLYSSTGGGHWAVTKAICDALAKHHGKSIKTTSIDFFTEYTTPPFSHFPQIYLFLQQHTWLWAIGYHLTNKKKINSLIQQISFFLIKKKFTKILHDHPADIIISVHPLACYPIAQLLKNTIPPTNNSSKNKKLAIVISDMITGHISWFENTADYFFVPTNAMKKLAVKSGINEKKITITGQPISEKFLKLSLTPNTSKKTLNFTSPPPLGSHHWWGKWIRKNKKNCSSHILFKTPCRSSCNLWK